MQHGEVILAGDDCRETKDGLHIIEIAENGTGWCRACGLPFFVDELESLLAPPGQERLEEA